MYLLSPTAIWNTTCGFVKSETSNITNLSPLFVTLVPFSFVSYPNPIICFSSYGCKYTLYPGSCTSPKICGFVASDKSITQNGSVCLNVTTYALLPIYLTEYIFSPSANPSIFPISSNLSFNTYKLLLVFWFDHISPIVVAILKLSPFSSIENWLFTLPSTLPLALYIIFPLFNSNFINFVLVLITL